MAVTQAQIDELNQMLADGVRQVTINGQTTTYNTTDSLIRARDDLIRQKAREDAATEQRVRPTRRYLYHAGRGY